MKWGLGKTNHGSKQQGKLDCTGLYRLRPESAADPCGCSRLAEGGEGGGTRNCTETGANGNENERLGLKQVTRFLLLII